MKRYDYYPDNEKGSYLIPTSTVSKKIKYYNGMSITASGKNEKLCWTVTNAKIRNPFLFNILTKAGFHSFKSQGNAILMN